MKNLSVLLALVMGATAATSSATVTLQFSNPAQAMASNWANGAGVGGSRLVWGIVVDSAADGFDNSYFNGINFGTTGAFQALSAPDGSPSDDQLFLATILMPIPNFSVDGITAGVDNVVSNLASVPLNNFGVNTGDAFEIVWFDRTAFGGISVYGESFGAFNNPTFTLPEDSFTVSYASAFTGPDPLKQMTHELVPEPSSALLGLLGIAGLVRRRR